MDNNMRKQLRELDEIQKDKLSLNFRLVTEINMNNKGYKQLINGDFYRTKYNTGGGIGKPLSKAINFIKKKK